MKVIIVPGLFGVKELLDDPRNSPPVWLITSSSRLKYNETPELVHLYNIAWTTDHWDEYDMAYGRELLSRIPTSARVIIVHSEKVASSMQAQVLGAATLELDKVLQVALSEDHPPGWIIRASEVNTIGLCDRYSTFTRFYNTIHKIAIQEEH